EAGYHRLEADGVETTLAVAPRRCFSVADALQGKGRAPNEPTWGMASQLYSLRRDGDGGLGNYTSLELLARSAAASGASALAISPVHAMFSADPRRFSPYGPSSRLFFNVLHIDPARVAGVAAMQEVCTASGLQERMNRLEGAALVDWPEVAATRLSILRALFDRWRAAPAPGFSEFCASRGRALEDHARFEALDAWLRRDPAVQARGDWRRWPASYRDPRGPAVEAFANAHVDDVDFHKFLQWLADSGCEGVQAAALEGGMAVGVVADLAVGADPGGSQAWGLQQSMLQGLTVGAPPDLLSRQGQGWGLGAFSPLALQTQGFEPWLAMLRANMRHSGGIRIDHVLGLKRLWLVPDGLPASSGAYLHYPFDDLLRLTALESARHGAIVVGEDLGTVPEGFSETLADACVLGIRVLWFQQDKGRFLAPHAWPRGAMATTSTHDLATVRGWWAGRDIDWRDRMGLLGDQDAAGKHRLARNSDRTALWEALQLAGCAGSGELPEVAPVASILEFMGQTPAPLVMVPLEDAFAMAEQPNLPGTVDTHPNWQQRLPDDPVRMLQAPEVQQRIDALKRGRAQSGQSALRPAAPPFPSIPDMGKAST
ncbi:MAG: malQ, partial [Polaromonas sp.]|nr:malQ [Polaromonas sp.]